MQRFFSLTLLLALAFSTPSFCQSDSLSLPKWLKNTTLSGHGVLNYHVFDWQTDTVKRNAVDAERFVLELEHRWTEQLGFTAEIEFEHGGTGVAVEFDRFEEFGEFEFDVAKGGEVWVEELNLELNLSERANFQAGRFKVPFGSLFDRSEPTDFATATFSEAEAALLPAAWTEIGLHFFGKTGGGKRHLRYHLAAVNGLDNSAFNSANWIKRGSQRRFELVSAENFAACARLDFFLDEKSSLGASAYFGNTTGNRPKPDLRADAPVLLLDVHASLVYKSLFFNGLLLWGSLENSEAVSEANRNLSNNLNVKRTPVGAQALAGFAELGMAVWQGSSPLKGGGRSSLALYGRLDWYDTMWRTEGLVFNNPRWKRRSLTVGMVFQLIEDVHLKMQLTRRKVGAPAPTSVDGGTTEQTFTAGLAFEF